MKLSKSCIVSILLSPVGLIAAGQSQSEKEYVPRDYSLVPPTPGVAQFLDFQNHSVDNFRGIPQISFPIYVIKSGAISIPITLSYHGGGIRTEQSCGNAGMGWSLSFGAEIGHTVNGAPDYANNGAQKVHGLFNLDSDERSFRSRLINKDYTGTGPNDYTNYQAWQSDFGTRYYHGLTDVANDTYNLYGLGMSAVFAFSEKNNLVVSAETPLRINKSSSLPKIVDGGCDAYGFEIYKQSGIKYLFLTQDRCRYDYSYGSPQLTQQHDSVYYASAWHLDCITDMNGNEVTYHYHEAPRYTKDMGNSVYRYYSEKQERMSNDLILHSVNSVMYKPQILDSITCEAVTVRINYVHQVTSNRTVPLVKSLSIISGDSLQREIRFNYRQHNTHYLKSIVDQDETILSFEYCDPEDNKFYFYKDAQDFGGYNNGIDNGGNLIPSTTL